MYQNVSLRCLGFEQRPLSLFSWKAKSLHHTMGAEVKVFNPQPSAALLGSANPPRLPACQSEKLTDFFSLWFRSETTHCFFFSFKSSAETWQVSMETTFVQMFPGLWRFQRIFNKRGQFATCLPLEKMRRNRGINCTKARVNISNSAFMYLSMMIQSY